MTKRKDPKDLKQVGRPSSYTEAIAAEICRRIVAGEGLRKICETPGMPHHSTVYNWLSDNPAFSDAYARARECQMDSWADELREIADDSSKDYIEVETPDGRVERRFDGEHVQRSRLKIDTLKFLMSKLAPRRFGDKVAVDLTAKTAIEDLTDDQLRERTRAAFQAVGAVIPEGFLRPLVPGSTTSGKALDSPEGDDEQP